MLIQVGYEFVLEHLCILSGMSAPRSSKRSVMSSLDQNHLTSNKVSFDGIVRISST